MRPLLVVLCVLAFGACVFGQSKIVSPWSQSTGLQYLYYAYAAYCPQSSLQSWNCKWCTNNDTTGFQPTFFAYDQKDNIFGYGGYYKPNNTIIVSFRGTEATSLKNWIDDLDNVVLVDYEGSTTLKVGDGWYNSYNSIESQVIAGVKALASKYPTANIAVTGHSLGAALAGMCALDLVEKGYKNVYVYDFGEPRLGNQAFANYTRSLLPTYFRTTNGNDIVPHLPYEWLGFYHQPQEVWEEPADQLIFKVCSATNGEDPTCSDSVVGDSIADHLHYYGIYEDCSN